MVIATVISITGQAWARDAEGNLRELSVGDTLEQGDVLVTSDNGSAQLDFGDGLEPALVEGGEQVVMTPELDADEAADVSEFAALDDDLEALLAALDDDSVDLLDVLDATAAGAGAGGGADGGHNFVRLARIAEDVNPLAFEFGLGQASDLPEIEGAAFQAASEDATGEAEPLPPGTITVAIDSVNSQNVTQVPVTGTTSDIPAGSIVTIVVSDQEGNTATTTATVDPGGNYQTEIDLSSLVDGPISVDASVLDQTGTTRTAEDDTAKDTFAEATITIDVIAGDDVVNGEEAQADVTITGTVGGDAREGDTVTLTVGEETFSGTVDADGNYAIDVPGSVLADNGQVEASVSGSDEAGNPYSADAERPYDVDATPPVVSVALQGAGNDGVYNADEIGEDGSVTAQVTLGDGTAVGDSLVVTDGSGNELFNGNVTQAMLDDGLALEVAITDDASDISVTATVTDPAGNSDTSSDDKGVDNVPPAVSVALQGAGDDGVYNADEIGENGSVTAQVTLGEGTAVGDSLVVTDGKGNELFNGDVTQAMLDDGLMVTITDLELTDTDVSVTATVTDPAGNSDTANDEGVIDAVNLTAPSVSAVTDEDVALSGNLLDDANTNVSEPSVTGFTVEGNAYQAGETAEIEGVGSLTIQADGSYLFEPSQDYSGSVPQIAYSVTNGHKTVTSTLDLSVTPVADTPDVTVNLTANDTTTHTVGGSNAQDPEGFSVSASKNGEAGEVDIRSSGGMTGFGVAGSTPGAAGAEIGNGESLEVTLDTPAESVSFQLAWLADGEHAEYTVHYTDGSSEAFVVSGDSPEGGHDGIGKEIIRQAPAGKMIAAIEFTTPGEGEAHHSDGNDYLVHQVSYVAATNYDVEITATPTDIDFSESITSVVVAVPDGISLSAGEQNADGTWTLPLESNGDYTVEIDPTTQAVTITGLTMSVPNDVTDPVTLTVTATALDGADTSTGTASVTALVANISIDTIAGDDVVNAAEAEGDITVTGSVTGDAGEGDTVTLTVGDEEFTGTVDADGNYAIDVPGSVLADNGQVEASVVGEDEAGNSYSADAERPYDVDTGADATISIDTIAGDDVVNAAEAEGDITITGSVTGDAGEGDTVTLTVGEETFTGTVDADGNYAIDVPGSVLVDNGQVEASVVGEDGAGNPFEATSNRGYDVSIVADAGETASTQEDTTLTGNVLDNAETNVGELAVTGFSVESVSYQAGETATIAGKGALTLQADGAYSFEPHQDYSGPVPQVAYSVTNGSETVSSTLELSVTPVADTPDVTVTLTEAGTTVLTVGGPNVNDPEGFSVTASKDGEAGEISIRDSGSPTGFGVAGEASNGAPTEIGNGESLEVTLDTPAESVSFQLAWLADWEHAEYTVHYTDGSSEAFVVSGDSPEGGHDGIGEEIIRQAPDGKWISSVEFTTPAAGEANYSDGNDYMLHQVSYVAATNYDVEITATPSDIDFSESITSVVVTVPDGISLSAGEQNADGSWTLPLESNGDYTVEIDPSTQAVTITGLTMSVPINHTDPVTLTATATVMDGADTATGTASAATEIEPTVGTPDISLTVTPEESSGDDSAGIIKVNGGSGVTGGYDVQDGQITKIGDGVRVWLTKGDAEPEIANPGSGNAGVIAYYEQGNHGGDSGYADIFVVHSNSGYFYTQSDWDHEELRSLDSVHGNRTSENASDAYGDYIFVVQEEGYEYQVGWSTNNNANTHVNTLDGVWVGYTSESGSGSLIGQVSNQIEGVIYGDGRFDGPDVNKPNIEEVVEGDSGDQVFLVDISAALADANGNEELSDVTLSGIPDDVTLEGQGVTKLDNGDWRIANPDGGNIDDFQITMTVPADTSTFDIEASVSAISQDGASSATAVEQYGIAIGSSGDDTLIGGPGNDILIGGLGDDVFEWNFGDQGSEDEPAKDVVKDFSVGNNVLDLADLLQGESADSLGSFIFAEQVGEDTVLHVKHDGGLEADGSNADQTIVLEGYGMQGQGSEEFIQQLLEQNQLHID